MPLYVGALSVVQVRVYPGMLCNTWEMPPRAGEAHVPVPSVRDKRVKAAHE